MNILHITLGRVNPNSANGINKVIEGLAKYTNTQSGNSAIIYTVRKKQVEKMTEYKRDGFNVIAFRSLWLLILQILRNRSTYDIVHLHNVWSYHNDVIATILLFLRKPYIITVHAGLAPDRVKGSNYRAKRIYHTFIQRRTFDGALFLHALSDEEVLHIGEYSLNPNIFRLPNGVNLPVVSHHPRSHVNGEKNQRVRLGYIGRFAKEKNVESLIRAVAILQQPIRSKIELRLAGPLDEEADELVELVSRTLNKEKIDFAGPLYGIAKEDFFLNVDFIVHPAISEGASISVLEAAAYGVPMVLSRSSAAAYFVKQDFFITVAPDPIGIAAGIEEMISRREEWAKMGRAARSFVKSNLTWELVASELLRKIAELLASKK